MSSLSRPIASSARASLKDANPYEASEAAAESTAVGRAASVPLSRYVLFCSIAAGGCLADLITKSCIFAWRGEPHNDNIWWLWSGYIGIETARNPGALFGMGRGYGWLFFTLSIGAAVGIVYWLFVRRAARDLPLTTALGMIMGGIFGNLYDRAGFGHSLDGHYKSEVRDWILFRYGEYTWPNFNIADSLLVVGACLLMWHAFVRKEKPE